MNRAVAIGEHLVHEKVLDAVGEPAGVEAILQLPIAVVIHLVHRCHPSDLAR